MRWRESELKQARQEQSLEMVKSRKENIKSSMVSGLGMLKASQELENEDFSQGSVRTLVEQEMKALIMMPTEGRMEAERGFEMEMDEMETKGSDSSEKVMTMIKSFISESEQYQAKRMAAKSESGMKTPELSKLEPQNHSKEDSSKKTQSVKRKLFSGEAILTEIDSSSEEKKARFKKIIQKHQILDSQMAQVKISLLPYPNLS